MWPDQFNRVFKIFCPSVPTESQGRLYGRQDECVEISRALMAPGRHLVVYGERGVGKTSVSAVAARSYAESNGSKFAQYQCGSKDTHLDVLRFVLREAGTLVDERRKSSAYERNLAASLKLPFAEGGGAAKRLESADFVAAIPDGITPNEVSSRLASSKLVILVDEFDRISDSDTRLFIAETIKALSNSNGQCRFIFCGVADKSSDLIGEHASMARNLRSLRVPYLPDHALRAIVAHGTKELGLSFSPSLETAIVFMSCGLPYFTHLLCEELSVLALREQLRSLELEHLPLATRSALGTVSEPIREQYQAFLSPEAVSLMLSFGELKTEPTPRHVRRLLVHAAALVSVQHCTPDVIAEKFRLLAGLKELMISAKFKDWTGSDIEVQIDCGDYREPFLRLEGQHVRFLSPFHRAYALLEAVSEIQLPGLPHVHASQHTDA